MIVTDTYGSRLDRAMDRGYDPHAETFDDVTPQPLPADWQAALDASVAQARALRDQAVA